MGRKLQGNVTRVEAILLSARRFIRKVRPATDLDVVLDGAQPDCWIWTGGSRGGYEGRQAYGEFSVLGRIEYAHRVAWVLLHGRLFPHGMDGAHTCNNSWCVNPRHIEPATHRDNLCYVTAERG